MGYAVKKPMMQQLPYLLVQTGLLCFWCFYNNFPFVFPDTGMYLLSGFEQYVPPDRPITYGLFLYVTSLGNWLWLSVVVQSLWLLLLLRLCVVRFTALNSNTVLTLVLPVLVTCTGVSFHASQLIPDIFTPILVISLGLLLFAPPESAVQKWLLGFSTVISTAMHNSHYLLFGVLALLLTLARVLKRNGMLASLITFRMLALRCWLVLVASVALLMTLNFTFAHHWFFSKGSHVFRMNHLIEIGFVQEFLDEHCDEHDYTLCQYRDKIPFDFIWDEQSPLYKAGGWGATKTEYEQLMREILSNPRYLFPFLLKSVEYTCRQLCSFETGDAPPATAGSAPHNLISKHLKREVRQFDLSLQNLGRLNFRELNNRQLLLIITSFCMLFLLLTRASPVSATPTHLYWFILFVLAGLVVNSFVCSGFSTVTPRLQSRVVWLIPFCLALVLAQEPIRRLLWQHLRKRVQPYQDK